MEVSEEVREISSSNRAMCLLTDPEGEPLGAPLYLPQNAGPPQLQEIVNKLLKNVISKISCLFLLLIILFDSLDLLSFSLFCSRL